LAAAGNTAQPQQHFIAFVRGPKALLSHGRSRCMGDDGARFSTWSAAGVWGPHGKGVVVQQDNAPREQHYALFIKA
jgi:hypothetical protein